MVDTALLDLSEATSRLRPPRHGPPATVSKAKVMHAVSPAGTRPPEHRHRDSALRQCVSGAATLQASARLGVGLIPAGQNAAVGVQPQRGGEPHDRANSTRWSATG